MGKFDFLLARCFYKFLFLEREPFSTERRKKMPRFSDYFQGGMGSPPNVSGPGGGSFGDAWHRFRPYYRTMKLQPPTNEGEFNRHYHAHLLLCEL